MFKFRAFPTNSTIPIVLGILFIASAVSTSRAADNEYKKVNGPCNLVFPADHGDHPEYRTEWWYYTGNLTAEDGRRFGFQLTFFRSALRPADEPASLPQKTSRWRTRQVYMAHAAVTDIEAGRHFSAEKMARQALGLAGVSRMDQTVVVELLDWQAVIAPEGHRLRSGGDDFNLNLVLKPLKDIVLHGDAGYSRKGSSPDRASCYYSLTRLTVSGSIGVKGRSCQVTGTAWMDHEFSSSLLEPGIIGWDWFSLQLTDHSEVMIFFLRDSSGGIHPASSGTYVARDGRVESISGREVEMAIEDHWKSPGSGARYPSRWLLTIPALDLTLRITPAAADQEMVTPQTTQVIYWEGSVSVRGRHDGQDVRGAGYVELTGYAQPFKAPM